jgi:hypothetical protein
MRHRLAEIPPPDLVPRVVSHALIHAAEYGLCDLLAKQQLLHPLQPGLGRQPVHHIAELGHIRSQSRAQQQSVACLLYI